MKDTCGIKSCAMAKKLGIKQPNQCPNYTETVWTNNETNETTHMVDCAPKRTLLMVMDLSNRLMGVQQAQEQQRNAFTVLSSLATAAKAKRKAISG